MTTDRLVAAFSDLKNILAQLQQHEKELANLVISSSPSSSSSTTTTTLRNPSEMTSPGVSTDEALSVLNQLNIYFTEVNSKLNAIKKIQEEFSVSTFNQETSSLTPSSTQNISDAKTPKNTASIGTKTVNQSPLQSASQSDIVPSQADSPSITVSSQSSNLSTLDLLSELEAIERELTRRLEELARTASQNSSQSPFSSTPQNTSNNIPTVDVTVLTTTQSSSFNKIPSPIGSPTQRKKFLIGTTRIETPSQSQPQQQSQSQPQQQSQSQSQQQSQQPFVAMTLPNSENNQQKDQKSPPLSPVSEAKTSSIRTQNVGDSVITSSKAQNLQQPSHSSLPVETTIPKKNIVQTNSKVPRSNTKNSNTLITFYNTPPLPRRGNFTRINPSTAHSKHYSIPQQIRMKPPQHSNIEPTKSLPKPIPSTHLKRTSQRHDYSPTSSSLPSPSPLISPAIKVSPNINRIIKSIYSSHNPPSQNTSSPSPKSKPQRPRIVQTKKETVKNEPNSTNFINNTTTSPQTTQDTSSLFEQEDKIINENLSTKGNVTPSSSPLSSSPYTNVNFLEYRIASPSRPSQLYAPQTTLILTSKGLRQSRRFVFSLLSSMSAQQNQNQNQTQTQTPVQSQSPPQSRLEPESSSSVSTQQQTSSSSSSSSSPSSLQSNSEGSSIPSHDQSQLQPPQRENETTTSSPPLQPPTSNNDLLSPDVQYEIIEDVVLPEEMNITFQLPPKKTPLRIPVKTDNSISIVKEMIFAEAEKMNVKIEGNPNEYCFCAEEDDYILDESIKMKELSYLAYCVKNYITPVIDLVPRSQYDVVIKQIEEMLGGPLPNYPEVAEFRKDMQITMSSVLRASYRRDRKSHSTQFTSVIEQFLCKHLPKEFKVNFFFSHDTPLSLNRKSVIVPQLATAGDALTALFKKCPGAFEPQPSVHNYVLKIRGVDEYLVSFMLLISMPYIRECLRKRRDVDFVIHRRSDLSTEIIEYINSLEQVLRKRKVIDISVFRRTSNVKVISPPPSLNMKWSKQRDNTSSPDTRSRAAYIQRSKTSATLRVNDQTITSLSQSPATVFKTTFNSNSNMTSNNENATGALSSPRSPLSSSPISINNNNNNNTVTDDNNINISSSPPITSTSSQSDTVTPQSQSSSPTSETNMKFGSFYGMNSWELHYPLRVRIKNLDPIPFDPKLFKIAKKKDPLDWYISVGVYHVGEPLKEPATTLWVFRDSNDSMPKPSQWLVLPFYSCIPWAAILHFQVHITKEKRDVVVAWTNVRIFDFRGFAHMGENLQALFLDNNPDPLAPLLQDISTGPKIHFEIETLEHPVVYPDFEVTSELLLKRATTPETCPRNLQPALLDIINKDPLYKLTKEDKGLLWKFRGWLKNQPKTIAKFLQSVPWSQPNAILETYTLLQTWPDIPPTDALELLNHHFVDKNIREFAVSQLQRLSDDDLQDFLLQLVQALKHEMNHDSALARFLIIRAIFNQTQIGHYFFWLLQGCLSQESPYRERYGIVLEIYLRYCGKFRERLREQTFVYKKLTEVAVALKQVKDKKKMSSFLREQLEALQPQLPSEFQVPIDSSLVAKRLLIDKCKYLDSKTFPLWLVFANADPLGDPISVILKVGDDLRQDQLTLQMFRIMDKMWLQEGLDLKMSPYQVIETGNETGMIEVVPNSETTAAIQKQYGGVKAAFSEKPLAQWLRKNNPDDQTYKNCVKDFVRSCAGYCVATYVLGIGDRHNDNVMCTTNGHLFHIDFGKFLGNVQKFGGVSRDRAPFVFTPEFAYVMGGTEKPMFRWFTALCCKAYNVLRKNANLFINLFAMMISTGIAELKSEEDIDYLKEAFSLELTDEQAAKKFEALIFQSLKTKATQWNNALHIMAHPEREKKEKDKG